jgi:hypothetical protein
MKGRLRATACFSKQAALGSLFLRIITTRDDPLSEPQSRRASSGGVCMINNLSGGTLLVVERHSLYEFASRAEMLIPQRLPVESTPRY